MMKNYESIGGDVPDAEAAAWVWNALRTLRKNSPKKHTIKKHESIDGDDSSIGSAEDELVVPKESQQKTEKELDDKEILNSERAKSILPYLTLNRLSEHEKAELLRLANDAIRRVVNKNTNIDPSLYYEFYEGKVSELVGEEEVWGKGKDWRMPVKTKEACKLFCASLFDAINRENDVYNISEAFFSTVPNFSSYCGNLNDNMELLSIAERSANRNIAKTSLYNEIIFDCSFGHHNDFSDILEQASPTKQLRLLPTIYGLSEQCQLDDWSNRTLDKISVAFDGLANSPNTTPLVALVAESMNRQIDSRVNDVWVVDMRNPSFIEPIENTERYKKREAKRRLEQDKLHLEYPTLPKNCYAVMVAPGIAGAFMKGRLNLIVDKDGKHGSLLEYNRENDFGIDYDVAELIGAAHNPIVKKLVDANLGLDLAKVPLNAQVQLLKYVNKAGSDRFYRFCNTLQNTDKGLRLKLANSFLAADFGEDFGDGLLDIANSERISSEQLSEILDNVESCRESIHGITDLYKDYDDRFAKSYTRAANERLTDAIATFRQIAKTGEAKADLDWAGETKFSFNEAMEALKYETESLKIIDGTLEDIKNGKKGTYAERVLAPESYSGFSYYNLYSPDHGYVLLYTRAEGSGSFDERMEYGKQRSKYSNDNSAGVEASISLITNPIDPFAKDERFGLPNLFKPDQVKAAKNPNYYDSRMNKVSAIRIDREGRAPGMAANDPLRNPMNKIGMISVDLAAINDRQDTPSGKIARLISTGNKLRSETSGTDFNLNHNTRWFDQEKYGTSDGFAVLVKYVDSLVMTWCNNTRPDKNTPSYRKLMRGGGRKAAVVAQNNNKQQTA